MEMGIRSHRLAMDRKSLLQTGMLNSFLTAALLAPQCSNNVSVP